MNLQEYIDNSVEMVKTKMLSDVDSLPERISECYSLCQTPFEMGLVDIFIAASYGGMSKKDAFKATANLKE